MGLIIQKIEKQGNVYENAYAKVGKMYFDNNSKLLTFSIEVYPEKGSKNIILSVDDIWLRPTTAENYLKQCYERLASLIEETKRNIAFKQNAIENTEMDENERLQQEQLLENMKKNEILMLEGAIEAN